MVDQGREAVGFICPACYKEAPMAIQRFLMQDGYPAGAVLRCLLCEHVWEDWINGRSGH